MGGANFRGLKVSPRARVKGFCETRKTRNTRKIGFALGQKGGAKTGITLSKKTSKTGHN